MTHKILVVSNNSADCKLFEDALKPKGFCIEGASLAQIDGATIIRDEFAAIHFFHGDSM